jgi:hypothetical protein
LNPIRAGLAIAALASTAAAHPGGLNAEGCHANRKTGDYHCHRAGAAPQPSRRKESLRTHAAAYPNCAAARAAGAAPIRRGEPGYGAHLDRDGDGVACER